MADIEVPTGEDFEIEMDGTTGLKVGSAGGITGSVVKDQDDMSSDSNTHLATQQSIKAYADSLAGDYIESEASSTDNQVVRWDGVTGAEVQSSLMTIDDAGTPNIPTAQSYKVNNAQHQHVEADITDLGSYLEHVVEDVAPQLGGDLQVTEKSIDFDPVLSADEKFSGLASEAVMTITETAECGHALYHTTTANQYSLANATDSSAMLCVALCMDDQTGSNGEKKVFLQGYIRESTLWTWTIGGLIYVDTNAGLLTQTKPTTAGNVQQCVGYAISTTAMYFNPQLHYETAV